MSDISSNGSYCCLFLTGETFSGIVMGHEISGYIDEFGTDVNLEQEKLKVGDYVVVFPWVGCDNCSVCASGNSNMCDNNQGGCSDFGQGHSHPGGYSTHVIVHSTNILFKVPSHIPKEMACMLPCSAATAFASLTKARPFLEQGILMKGKAQLLVVGAGGLGLWCIQLAKLMFSEKHLAIYVADINDGKLCNALRCGANFKILWNGNDKTNKDAILDALKTGEEGITYFDAAIDFVASDKTFVPAYKNLRRGATLVAVGMFGGNVTVPLIDVVSKNICIQGNRVFGIGTFSAFLKFLKGKTLNYPNPQQFKLHEINGVLKKLRNSEITGRAVINF